MNRYVLVTEEEKVKCPQCDKRFFDKQTLKSHLRTHSGERPFPCPHCSRRLSSKHALKAHVRIHTNESPYTCPHCPLKFKHRASINHHVKSKHSKPLAVIKVGQGVGSATQ